MRYTLPPLRFNDLLGCAVGLEHLDFGALRIEERQNRVTNFAATFDVRSDCRSLANGADVGYISDYVVVAGEPPRDVPFAVATRFDKEMSSTHSVDRVKRDAHITALVRLPVFPNEITKF